MIIVTKYMFSLRVFFGGKDIYDSRSGKTV